MRGQMLALCRETVGIGFLRTAPRIVRYALLAAAALSIASTNAQGQPTIWNQYSGSQSVYVDFSTYKMSWVAVPSRAFRSCWPA